MAETRQVAQRRRAEGRDRRRSLLTEPFERLNEASGNGESSGQGDVRETLKRATAAAAVAAVAGALAGAAKALLDRREAGADRRHGGGDRPEDDGSGQSEGRAERADEGGGERREGDEPADGRADDQPQGGADPSVEPADDGDEPEGEDGGDPQDRAEPAGSRDEDDGTDLEDAANADSGPGEIVPKAREELERLLGREAESVSGFERKDGHWSVMLEVVEVRRIPDSTDVLASYELTLDDDGRVARMTRTRRYRRSQLEGE